MAVETRRGCGYRKIGGTYLEGDPGKAFFCGRIPVILQPCPLCDQRPAFTRGLQRIVPQNVLHSAQPCTEVGTGRCQRCPFEHAFSQEEAGLMWVGARFYTPEGFVTEAIVQGVSKRIPHVPKWFKVGMWVMLAHEAVEHASCAACEGRGYATPTAAGLAKVAVPGGVLNVDPCERCEGTGQTARPGIFYAFRPKRIVRIVPTSISKAEHDALVEAGLTPILVPANDPDHAPSRRNEEGD